MNRTFIVKSFFALIGLFLANGCMEEKKDGQEIVKIPEASGICYSSLNQTLFVVQDEGKVVQIDTEGNIQRKEKLGKYDLEGIACDDAHGRLYLAVEKKESVLVVDMKSLKVKKEVKIDRDFEGKRVIAKDDKHGIEGITLIDGELYLSNQSTKPYPNKDASIVFKIDGVKGKKAKITGIFDHGFIDVAGLDYHNGYLYMVSDKEDMLVKYDIARHKTVQTYTLDEFAQEGIAFDDKGYVYFADDNGGIRKYKSERFE